MYKAASPRDASVTLNTSHNACTGETLHLSLSISPLSPTSLSLSLLCFLLVYSVLLALEMAGRIFGILLVLGTGKRCIKGDAEMFLSWEVRKCCFLWATIARRCY